MAALRTFRLPETVRGTSSDRALGRDMVDAWRSDGLFQIATSPVQAQRIITATTAGRLFFSLPVEYKARHVSDLSYSGYGIFGEAADAGVAGVGETGRPEIFTVCKDVPAGDARVRERWPCHGPVPWPDCEYRLAMRAFMDMAGAVGDTLLRLVALGLGLPAPDELTRLTHDGWHHLRVLRFSAEEEGPVTRRPAHGIGAHTDYGLLIIAVQDEVGGLSIRPPVQGERRPRNWLESESTAGLYEDDAPWIRIPPVPGVLSVYPGDVMQFLTGGYILSTPHKVALAGTEHHALAYYHEPAFETTLRPLLDDADRQEGLHYGTHFTTMMMRRHPERAATRRILGDGRLDVLDRLRAAPLSR
ncbi:2OG-Fe(II) oxygenase family protein [Actinomadura sp. SCN-SB]|uniref:2OG-Fe(II) oxygenase family protein n=1 Tax=Actinomadura sp. SCN-SB TaxID=3373092 RepID=UPI003750EF14